MRAAQDAQVMPLMASSTCRTGSPVPVTVPGLRSRTVAMSPRQRGELYGPHPATMLEFHEHPVVPGGRCLDLEADRGVPAGTCDGTYLQVGQVALTQDHQTP